MGFLDECMNSSLEINFEGGDTRSQNSAGLGTCRFETTLVAWVGRELTVCCGSTIIRSSAHGGSLPWQSVDFSLSSQKEGTGRVVRCSLSVQPHPQPVVCNPAPTAFDLRRGGEGCLEGIPSAQLWECHYPEVRRTFFC